MLESLAINVLSERTLEFVLPGGGKLTGAAIYCAASEYDTQSVSINFLSNGRELFKVQLSGLTLNGTSYSTAAAAVTALNAVIGAAFRAGGGSSSTTQPDMSNYYNKTEVDNALGAQATAVGTLITNEQTVRQQNDATLQTAINGKAAASHTHTIANVTNLQTTLDNKVEREITSGTDSLTTINHDGTYVENQWAKQDGSAYANVGAASSGAYMGAADANNDTQVLVTPNDAKLIVAGTRAALTDDSIIRKKDNTHTMYMHNLTLKSTDTTIMLQYTNDSATRMTWADIMAMLPQNSSTVTFIYPCSGKSAAGMVFAMYHYHYRWDDWIDIIVFDTSAQTQSIVTLAEADFTIYDWVITIRMT